MSKKYMAFTGVGLFINSFLVTGIIIWLYGNEHYSFVYPFYWLLLIPGACLVGWIPAKLGW